MNKFDLVAPRISEIVKERGWTWNNGGYVPYVEKDGCRNDVDIPQIIRWMDDDQYLAIEEYIIQRCETYTGIRYVNN